MKKLCPADDGFDCPPLPRQKRLTRAELERRLAEAVIGLGRAERTISTLMHVAEGGGVEKGDSDEHGAVQRCINAKRADAAARDVLQREIDRLKASERISNGLMTAANDRLGKLQQSLRRRDGAIGILSSAMRMAAGAQIPATVDVAIAGVMNSRIE